MPKLTHAPVEPHLEAHRVLRLATASTRRTARPTSRTQRPSAEASAASSALSTSISRISRQRPAPIETRSAISRRRASACAVQQVGDVDAGDQQHDRRRARPARAAAGGSPSASSEAPDAAGCSRQPLAQDRVDALARRIGRQVLQVVALLAELKSACSSLLDRASVTPGRGRTHRRNQPQPGVVERLDVHQRRHEQIRRAARLGADEARRARRRSPGRTPARRESQRLPSTAVSPPKRRRQ